jgi:hypothetical protein
MREDGYDDGAVLAREALHREYYDKPAAREAPFRVCARSRYFDWTRLTPFDTRGSCAMCSTEIVYDRHATADAKPKVCVPCALRLVEKGMTELASLGGWEPSMDGIDDATLYARLQANIVENSKYGAVDPKRVLGDRRSLPQHALRRAGQDGTKGARS